uniref:Uncharacterized protein n=1 Tax=Anguilla anguilla TaxID=7936 RepID=A0A0E9Y060_ANGAN
MGPTFTNCYISRSVPVGRACKQTDPDRINFSHHQNTAKVTCQFTFYYYTYHFYDWIN